MFSVFVGIPFFPNRKSYLMRAPVRNGYAEFIGKNRRGRMIEGDVPQ